MALNSGNCKNFRYSAPWTQKLLIMDIPAPTNEFEYWYEQVRLLERQSGSCAQTKKHEGITYTPAWVVEYMISLLDIQEHEVIHEMSCGRGMFVVGLVKHWRQRGKSWEWINEWAHEHLKCVDTDHNAIKDLQYLWQEIISPHLPETFMPLNAHAMDALFGALSKETCDVMVGNPPYVRVQHLQDDYLDKLRAHYSSCARGNVDLYYAFIEHALTHAKRVCLITPNSWMSNQSAKHLRKLMAPRLSHVVDFQSQLVFAPVRAYTSITLFGAPATPSLMFSNDTRNAWKFMDKAAWVPPEKLLLPWASQDTDAHHSVLSDHCHVLGGLATLSDKSFILPSPTLSADGLFVLQKDPLNDNQEIRVPIEFAPILIKATDGAQSVGRQRILFPYRNAKIVAEKDLSLLAPDLLSWLTRRRAQLERRDKGKTQQYDSWYAYGRRQGLHEISGAVVVVPQMGNGALHPFEVSVTSPQDRFVFTSGYVLVPTSPHVNGAALASAVASPQMWSYVTVHGRQWAGKGDYRTIGAKDLRKAPMPPAAVQAPDAAELASSPLGPDQ